MANPRITIEDESDYEISSSLISNIGVPSTPQSDNGKRLRNLTQNIRANRGTRIPENTKITNSFSSFESHSSFESLFASRQQRSILNSEELKKFQEDIKKEYDRLLALETDYCYYINDRVAITNAREQLKEATNGTFFVRNAELKERVSNVEYFLTFACYKDIVELSICYDKKQQVFSFLSGGGHGSEIERVYTGIDLMIQHKQENIFHELQYPNRISLYRPIDPTIAKCSPLPDEVRARGCQNTILHDLVKTGSLQCFKELIRMTKDDTDPSLRQKSLFIMNKINGRNKQGLTPLILAIQSVNNDFIDVLLNNNADINRTDSQGRSPLHHACLQANPKILEKLIGRHADPYYFNRKETTDGTRQSNLSALHYLAMARNARQQAIKRCAIILMDCGYPLMPLTREGKSPFDIANMYKNNAYECVKKLRKNYEYLNLSPIEVSNRNAAKAILTDLACPSVFGKIKLRIKKYETNNCVGNDGLFLLYKTKRNDRSDLNGELGLCVYHDGLVSVYPISNKHSATITDPSYSSNDTVFHFSLITDRPRDDDMQVVVFTSYHELIYHHTKYKGILPTLLRDFVTKEADELIMKKATMLMIGSASGQDSTDDKVSENENDDNNILTIDVTSIDRIDISQICYAELLNKSQRRFIWIAEVRHDLYGSFPVVIKDYLPRMNVEEYEKYRFKQLNRHERNRNNISNENISFEFSSHTRSDYKHESDILLERIEKHPFIIHVFICNKRLENDLRIFMECLPLGDLHTHLTSLKTDSPDSLRNAFHWIYQLAQVMAFLSTKCIVHRDIAARNILLKNEKHIKLTDFGLSRREGAMLEEERSAIPLRWSAPECLERNGKIRLSSDVWSFAIVIWEIYSFGAVPYQEDTNNNPRDLCLILKKFLIKQGARLSRPAICARSMYDLMLRCWNGNATKRPTFTDIINEFNGTSGDINIVPFTEEERKAWTNARIAYVNIMNVYSKSSDVGGGYVTVADDENDLYVIAL